MPFRLWSKFKTWWHDPFRSRPNPAEHLTVFLTVVIAVVGMLQYSVYRQQKRIMESSGGQTDQLIQQAQIQAAASQRNAVAAEHFAASAGLINKGVSDAVIKLQAQAEKMETARKTAELSSRKALDAPIDSSRTDQRAWIDLIISAPPAFQADQPFSTNAQVKNLGKTPAKNIQMGDAFEGLSAQTTYSFDHAKLTMTRMGMLPPQGPALRPVEITPGKPHEILGQGRFDAISRGSIVLFYWGLVTYDDVFGIHHWLKFCYIYNVPHSQFDLCAIHNDIDPENR